MTDAFCHYFDTLIYPIPAERSCISDIKHFRMENWLKTTTNMKNVRKKSQRKKSRMKNARKN